MSEKILAFAKSSVFSTVRFFHNVCTVQINFASSDCTCIETFYLIATRSLFGVCLLSKCNFFTAQSPKIPLPSPPPFVFEHVDFLDTQAKGCIAQSTQMPKSIIAHGQTIQQPH